MTKREREIREMLERAWREEDARQKSFVTLSESNLRLLAEYYEAGVPYGATPEGFQRWLEEVEGGDLSDD